MGIILVEGGIPLYGEINISGSKNAALPILAASILCDREVKISNIPDLKDIESMTALLAQHGVKTTTGGTSNIELGSKNRSIILNAKNITNLVAPYELVSKMRASILVLGPLLARFGEAKVSLPGGCAIGTRPVDMHIKAIREMGAEVELSEGYIIAKVNGKLKGAEIFFDKVSVGATENIMMAAVLAEGKTIMHNAAREPEIVDLAKFLKSMGAIISGEGTDIITVEGVDNLLSTEHEVIGDRIEAGSYAVAAAITRGKINLKGIEPEMLRSQLVHFKEIGIGIEEGEHNIIISGEGKFHKTDIKTEPYPNFSTDLQAQMMTLLAIAEGTSHIRENIFENRFMHVPELNRMGAKISVEGNLAIVEGVEELKSAEVMATDLRASMALVLAALSANGGSVISRIYHLDRGYEHLDDKLGACGAKIKRAAG
ncbi:UDP-N-acetylglucosamine 1-carboxyvinyltransferase [Holosporaceae bacterium 'Namur']|nr:UDP-N-acetylglucosamine 1-carboxyvinyltransferase [Holosporaceae bacterium 'Namur']